MKPLQVEEVQFRLFRRFMLLSRPLHIYKVANFIMIKLRHKNILKSKQILPSPGFCPLRSQTSDSEGRHSDCKTRKITHQ